MNQHPLPAANVQYSPLLAFTQVPRVQDGIQRAGEEAEGGNKSRAVVKNGTKEKHLKTKRNTEE